jgi:hypothetical protein
MMTMASRNGGKQRGWHSALIRSRAQNLIDTETEINAARGRLDVLIGKAKTDQMEADAGYMDPWERLRYLETVLEEFKSAAR